MVNYFQNYDAIEYYKINGWRDHYGDVSITTQLLIMYKYDTVYTASQSWLIKNWYQFYNTIFYSAINMSTLLQNTIHSTNAL